jgi:hypothetical protein
MSSLPGDLHRDLLTPFIVISHTTIENVVFALMICRQYDSSQNKIIDSFIYRRIESRFVERQDLLCEA